MSTNRIRMRNLYEDGEKRAGLVLDMLEKQNKMVFFGLQAFVKNYLLEYFQKNFFDLSEEELLTLYTESMNVQIGEERFQKVHWYLWVYLV